ncbi:hypothetical protein HBH61_001290 [Parastagonospora nodorum]|nr:hypothetical protein HBH52_149650 [Parastagonospora nodorum]KAH4823419.1 hypothetical protein HBH61_001290 [Parastagonospora nodorum]KAH5045506.1 hypothetical protein HBI75_011200 [Parastagonospora nodorum]KAH5075668.1 hypothetical protein HBH95_130350 [Parastagonospora nodorum]KAH5205922.1 hypothetical protein HBH68_093800 [Parastagonospora nodorum]
MGNHHLSELCLRHIALMEIKLIDIQTNTNKCEDATMTTSLAMADLMNKIDAIGGHLIQDLTDVIGVLLLALLAAMVLNIGLGYQVWKKGSSVKKHAALPGAISE